nr:MAG TPA: hypothetical protein [Caudoviricetes sp.]
MRCANQHRMLIIQRLSCYIDVVYVYQLLFMVDIVIDFLCYSGGFV